MSNFLISMFWASATVGSLLHALFASRLLRRGGQGTPGPATRGGDAWATTSGKSREMAPAKDVGLVGITPCHVNEIVSCGWEGLRCLA
jgi:hypothetical protein